MTVSGSVGNSLISFQTTSLLQQALAEQILNASKTGSGPQVVAGGGGKASAAVIVDTSSDEGTLMGSADFPAEQVMMVGQRATFVTGGASVAAVFCADGTNSSVVNSNPFGSLLAVTGTGGNVLAGLAGANQFVTGAGGQDIAILNGQANKLEGHGADAVLVGGPSTITVGESGMENVAMTSGTTLAFINGSRAGLVDTVTGSASGTITVAGTGATSVVAGSGLEVFFVDTSAGNVTLDGNRSGSDVFTFVAGSAHGTGGIQVNDFIAGDVVNLLGYSGQTVSQLGGSSGSMIALSDGSHIAFNNVSVASLLSAMKPI